MTPPCPLCKLRLLICALSLACGCTSVSTVAPNTPFAHRIIPHTTPTTLEESRTRAVVAAQLHRAPPSQSNGVLLCSASANATTATNGTVDTAAPSGRESSAELLEKGRQAAEAGSLKTAMAYFRKAADYDPHNPQYRIEIATQLLKQNQPEAAIEVLAPAARQFPQSAATFCTLGLAYYKTGDYRNAQKSLQQSLSLDNTNALAYFLMGCTATKLGQFEEADAQLRKAQALDPRYAVRH